MIDERYVNGHNSTESKRQQHHNQIHIDIGKSHGNLPVFLHLKFHASAFRANLACRVFDKTVLSRLKIDQS